MKQPIRFRLSSCSFLKNARLILAAVWVAFVMPQWGWAQCTPAQRKIDSLALVTLYNATKGPAWSTSWDLSEPMDTWYGIGLTPQGCVGDLAVVNNNLDGTLPNAIYNIKNLERIDLQGNKLTGSVGAAIGNLPKLEVLALARNTGFTGSIPAGLTNCANLSMIYLEKTQVGGSLPTNIGQLKNLRYIYLSDTKIGGTIPSGLASLAQLNCFDAKNCSFQGTIPNLKNLVNLVLLGLSNNDLTVVPANYLPSTVANTGVTNDTYLTASGFGVLAGHINGLYVQGNALTFSNLLPLANPYFSAGLNFPYAPQDSVFRDTVLVRSTGQNLDFSLDFDENVASNVYRWYKNGVFQFQVVGNNNLVINNLQPSDAGVWRVQVTNAALPSLTLYSRKITLNLGGGACNIALSNITTSALTGSFTLSGGPPQTNGSNYASVTMTLQGSPAVTATLTTAPFTHNETVSFTCPQAGTYTVVATDAGGCTGTGSITVSAAPTCAAPNMVAVEGGTFTMGCTPDQQGQCDTDEKPAHEVTLSDFEIGKYEMTQSEWTALMGSNPSYFKACGEDCPVEQVSWYDAAVYCNRLSECLGYAPCYYADAAFTQIYGKNGTTWSLPNSGAVYWKQNANGYHLPTEAEWEYAARGSNNAQQTLYSGSNNLDAVGWYEANSGTTTHPKGGKSPNSLSIYDMSGNAWEWCHDWYLEDYYTNSPACAPTGADNGGVRSLRGGLWGFGPLFCRVASRTGQGPDARGEYVGFRLARTPIPAPPPCVVALTHPTNGATSVALTTAIEWAKVPAATGYRLSLGTAPGSTQLLNNQDLGDTTRYNPVGCLPQNTTVHVSLTPYNADGSATGCTGFSFTTGSGVPEMVLVPGGIFQMGCTSEQANCDVDENPVHNIFLDSFLLGKHEVTQCEWERLIGNWPLYFENCGSDCPVEKVSWYDAATFCNKLSIEQGLEPVYYFDVNYTQIFDSLVGNSSTYVNIHFKQSAKGYRLPTESEWECAARRSWNMPQVLYSGSSKVENVGWYFDNSQVNYTPNYSGKGPYPVGEKISTALGFSDMSGNLWEWCWDWHASNYYNVSTEFNPKGPSSGSYRTIRGGSFASAAPRLRVANRSSDLPGSRYIDYGFRICRTIFSESLVGCVPLLTTPTNGAANVPVTTHIIWQSATNASGYRISLSTTPNGANLVNSQDVGSALLYIPVVCLPAKTTIYVNLTPYNNNGDAVGCTAFSFTTGDSNPEMVLVPGGTINLGGTPNTMVKIDSFLIGRYEVTQCEWQSVMGNNSTGFPSCGNCPMNSITWYHMIEFCNRISLQQGFTPVYSINGSTNPNDWGTTPISANDPTWDAVAPNWNAKGYRLPTEAEWEYAARGAINIPNYLYVGSNMADEVGWYSLNNSPDYSKPIGQKKPNELEIYDMSGNVSEWCWDWWSPLFPWTGDNPKGPTGGTHRVMRGGFYSNSETRLQVADRWDNRRPGVRASFFGFRLARKP